MLTLAPVACKKPATDMFGTLIGHRTVRNRLVPVCLLGATPRTLPLLRRVLLELIMHPGRLVNAQVRADPLELPGFTTVRALLERMARAVFPRTGPTFLPALMRMRRLPTLSADTAASSKTSPPSAPEDSRYGAAPIMG